MKLTYDYIQGAIDSFMLAQDAEWLINKCQPIFTVDIVDGSATVVAKWKTGAAGQYLNDYEFTILGREKLSKLAGYIEDVIIALKNSIEQAEQNEINEANSAIHIDYNSPDGR